MASRPLASPTPGTSVACSRRAALAAAALVLAPRALGCAEAGDELRRDVGLGLPRVMLGAEARPPDAEAALLRVLGEHLLHLVRVRGWG